MRFAHEGAAELADDLVDLRSQFPAVVLRAVPLAQFVRLSILAERVVVLPHVVMVLAEGVAQTDFVRERQALCKQRLNALQPGGVGSRHFAMCGNAAKKGRKIRIDRQRSLEQLLRLPKLAAVGAQVTQQAQCRDIVRLRSERGAAARLGLGGATLQAQCRRESQMGRCVVRPQRQGAAETCHRLSDTSELVQRVAEVAANVGALRTELEGSAVRRQRFAMVPAARAVRCRGCSAPPRSGG